MLAAVRRTLADLQAPASNILRKLRRVAGVDVGAFGFKFDSVVNAEVILTHMPAGSPK